MGQLAPKRALHRHYRLALGSESIEDTAGLRLQTGEIVEQPSQHNGPRRIGAGRLFTIFPYLPLNPPDIPLEGTAT